MRVHGGCDAAVPNPRLLSDLQRGRPSSASGRRDPVTAHLGAARCGLCWLACDGLLARLEWGRNPAGCWRAAGFPGAPLCGHCRLAWMAFDGVGLGAAPPPAPTAGMQEEASPWTRRARPRPAACCAGTAAVLRRDVRIDGGGGRGGDAVRRCWPRPWPGRQRWCTVDASAYVELHCRQAVRILDFAHAAGTIWRHASTEANGAAPRRCWTRYAAQRHTLRHGDPDRVLAALVARPTGEAQARSAALTRGPPGD